MNIETSKEINYTILILSGEVDALSAINLDENIKKTFEKGEVNILVDCYGLAYISSAGLGVFMSYIKRMETEQKQLILFNLSEEIYSTFEILGLHLIVTIVGTKEEAISKC